MLCECGHTLYDHINGRCTKYLCRCQVFTDGMDDPDEDVRDGGLGSGKWLEKAMWGE